MKTRIRIAALALALLLLLPLASCSSSLAATSVANKTVLRAGDMKVPYENLWYIAMNRRAELTETYGENALEDPAVLAEYESFVWSNLLTREFALMQIGETYGLDIGKGDIAEGAQSEIDALISENYEGDKNAYIEALDASYMTESYLRRYFATENYLAEAIVVEMLQKEELNDSDEATRELIEGENFIRTVHVYISKTNGYSEETNRANAAQIAAEVAAGADAAARSSLMRSAIGGRYNNDFGDTTGDGYYFAKGEMESAYEEAAFALAEYEVSPVVETSAGFYIIFRMPKEEEYINENFQSLKEKSYFILLNDKVDEILAGTAAEKTAFGESLDLKNLPEITANGGAGARVFKYVLIGVGFAALCAVIVIVTVKKTGKNGKNKKKKK